MAGQWAQAGDCRGPGPGKTRTVTYRVASLVEARVPPGAITAGHAYQPRGPGDAAARRGARQGRCAPDPGAAPSTPIGNRLLRRHATSLGYGPNFTILDAEDATDLIDLCIGRGGHRHRY
jgi:DNA helicase-2/ATP-dependent DNA helicase PcrA